SIEIDPEVLKHVNLNDGTGGNVGLLKEGRKLQWPAILQGKEYDPDRATVELKVGDAVGRAGRGQPIDRGTLTDLKAALAHLHATLDDNVTRMTPSEYIENKRYLNMLDDAYRALNSPNVGNYFRQEGVAAAPWAAKGKTVGELVEDVRAKGLKFAAA